MSGDEVMSDAELDAFLRKANDDLIASLNVDVEAGLRDVLQRARQRRRVRLRLRLRAYWADILCAAIAAAMLVWLVAIGWPQ